jgi:ABC-type amino acid transport substrate-binding protein
MLVALGAVRATFELQERPYEGYELFMGRSLLLGPAAASEASVPPEGGLEGGDDRPTLQRIQSDGVLRVGYAEDRLPFVFRNHAGELVGLDVEMMNVLARDLESRVEFVLIDRDHADRLLDEGAVDIVIGGWAVTPQRLQRIGFSAPYLDSSLAFVVPDHRREEFSSRDRVKALTPLRLGVPKGAYLPTKVQEYLPEAEIVLLDSPRQFFTERDQKLDALVYSAEAGSAWTLVYPEYSVAVPHPDSLASPVAFGVARGDREFADFLSAWVGLKQKDHTISRLFAYWIEGQSPAGKRRRWCVIRDVLGWVE